MNSYKDIDNDSGVSAYEYGEGWIHIKFSDGKTYEYKPEKIGHNHIAAMKKLADSGDGLNAYINEHKTVLKGYSRKW